MIDESVLGEVLDEAMRGGAGFAEVFLEDVRSTGAVLDDGRVEDLSSGRDRGAGIRVVVGDTTGFAHTSDLSPASLLRTARTAATAASRGARSEVGGGTITMTPSAGSAPSVQVLPESIAKETKVALLARADAAARAAGPAISQVSARYSDTRRRIRVANSDGLVADDDQIRTLFAVSCVASGDTGLQTGYKTLGHTIGFELFDDHSVEDQARLAADQAIGKLIARPAPSEPLPVVIAAGSGGILFHEACGHGLEADLVAKSASVFAGRTGELVASPLVTLVDDGTVGGEWGRVTIDDEGRPAQRNVLIENGVLTDYMWDRIRADKDGRPSSGNGRRQSYRALPMVRMTNTFIEAGESAADDIIASTDRGVYVAQLGGGQVNTASGDFVFGMTEAYLIEDGQIGQPLRQGNLIGNGPEALSRIDAVATDFSMGGPGTCGKDGQSVPVGTGTPTLRVEQLTIGGTA